MNALKKEVSKEELANYPLSKYNGKVEVITDAEAAEKVIPLISKNKIIGIDTETKPSFKKGVIHRVALIQIATVDCVYLFRINRIGLTESLVQLFSSSDIVKVGIALTDDIRDLTRIKQFEAKSFLDLNVVAKSLGYESIGAKKLSALLLGFRISKRQQTSNWEIKELSPQQIDYAATDAWICLSIFKKMRELYPPEQVHKGISL